MTGIGPGTPPTINSVNSSNHRLRSDVEKLRKEVKELGEKIKKLEQQIMGKGSSVR